MKTKFALSLVVLLLTTFAAAQRPVYTFTSTSDNFRISVPAANFKQIATKTGNTVDGFPFTETQYAGDNPQGDYIVVVTTFDRVITKERLIALANTQHGEIYGRADDLDVDGQYAVRRMVRVTEGGVEHKMANWMTAKGTKFYQIIFGSDLTAQQINFDEMNAFCESFKFIQ
jgi:hypothetical protein